MKTTIIFLSSATFLMFLPRMVSTVVWASHLNRIAERAKSLVEN